MQLVRELLHSGAVLWPSSQSSTVDPALTSYRQDFSVFLAVAHGSSCRVPPFFSVTLRVCLSLGYWGRLTILLGVAMYSSIPTV